MLEGGGNLRALEATGVTPRCGEIGPAATPLVLCEVKALVLGEPFTAGLGPDVGPDRAFAGVSVTGGVGEMARLAFPFPRSARPIALPDAPSG